MANAAKREYAPIEREQHAFDRALKDMLAEHEGEFVLFHSGRPVAFFPIYEEAYRAGIERFGLAETFLVSEVRSRERTMVRGESSALSSIWRA